MVQQTGAATRRMTMADLAALAGVAKITVSRALNDSPLVRDEIKERIQQLARRHGYFMNTAARNLRTRRTHSVAVVIEMEPSQERPMSEPVVLHLVGGLLQEFTLSDYRLILTTRSQILRSGALDVDGLILVGQGAHDGAAMRMRELNRPLVVWGSPTSRDEGVTFVGSDNRAGGRLVGEHLAALGRRRIAFLGDTAHPEVRERYQGLVEALGVNASVIVLPCPFSQMGGGVAVRRALRQDKAIDAVAAASDGIAIGARNELIAQGVGVPEDVAVIGYDDLVGDSGITSVHQAWDEAGRVLAHKLLDLIAGRPAASVTLPVRLVVRGSSDSSASH